MSLEIEGRYKAWPLKELSKNGVEKFVDTLAGHSFEVHWDSEQRNAYILDNNGKPMVTTIAYWFSWFTFHPQTKVIKAYLNDPRFGRIQHFTSSLALQELNGTDIRWNPRLGGGAPPR